MSKKQLEELFAVCNTHRDEHSCGGYPYEYGEVLTSLVAATKPKRILEVGTGLGYTSACMVYGFDQTTIDTIDQDESHSLFAKKHWENLRIAHQITQHIDKAEAILPTLQGLYDFIFFDAYAPSLKFMVQYQRLLKIGGVLMTANLFVKDRTGGRYLRELQREWKWRTGLFADTAISVKLW